jgi:hypothetical protein
MTAGNLPETTTFSLYKLTKQKDATSREGITIKACHIIYTLVIKIA